MSRYLLVAALQLTVVVSSLVGTSPQVTAQVRQLEEDTVYTVRIAAGSWRHFYLEVEDWDSGVRIDVESSRFIKPELYVRRGEQPTATEYDFRSRGAGRDHGITIDPDSSPSLQSGRWYISLYSSRFMSAELVASKYPLASRHGGMGAIPWDGGTAFRVWAPFAESVHVAGEFNDWSPDAAALVSEGNGNWSLDHRGATPGEQYRYVIRNGDQTLWRPDPREEQIENSIGNSIVFDNEFPWTDGLFQTPNWDELVVYEMHVGTLNDAPGFGPGHFDSAIDRLDHIRDLGCNAVCVMPINEFAGDFSWGYNPAQPYAVESAYGGPRAFKRFVDAAHARGIAVILDVVHNHWGPSDLELWRFDGWSENGWGGIYFYQDDRAITPWGDTRPDFGRGEVRQYIRDHVMMWLTEFHCDGIRWDSVSNIRETRWGENPEGYSLLQWINNEIDASQPWAISIAEDLQANEWVTRDTWAGGAGFDSQWDSRFVHPVREVIETANDDDRDMNAIRDAIQFRYNGDALERVIYTESHDEVANGRQRVPEEIWPGNAGSWFSRKRSTLGAALVMTAPGVPMIFQGQEILEDGWFTDQDPVDWSRESTWAGIEQLYTDLIRLRRNWWNQTRGLRGQHVNVFHVNHTDKLVAFHRWDQGGAGDDVLVICNFRDRTWDDYRIGLPRGGVWKVRFNSDWEGYSDDFGNFYSPDVTADGGGQDGLNFSGSIRIAPYSVLILSQD